MTEEAEDIVQAAPEVEAPAKETIARRRVSKTVITEVEAPAEPEVYISPQTRAEMELGAANLRKHEPR